ncbi:MAG: helicase-exonuclease AddAB subunit AddA [Oscillospiraceae bacterium]|nr:helicase-exonuclease AddAB subunit AddA [Oscillospiraceae bacterium]
MGFQLTKDQAAAVYDRGGGVLVSAAAGSGKTKVLVERLMSYLTDGEVRRNIDTFLMITYTKAAASELRGKIVEELGKLLARNPGDRHLRRQSALVYKAEIQTVHGFCSALIRENAHLLHVDPDFRVADEGESEVLKRQALDTVMERRYETREETDGFFALVDTLSAGRDDTRLFEIVLDTDAKLQSHPYPGKWLRARLDELRLDQTADAGETPWGRFLLEDAKQQTIYWKKEMQRAVDLILGDPIVSKAYFDSFAETVAALDGFLKALCQGWDQAAGCGSIPFPRLGSVRKFEDKALLERVKGVRTRCKQRMGRVTGLFEDKSDVLISGLRAVRPAIQALFSLTEDFEAEYRREKERRRLLDFADLEHIAVSALLDEETGAPTQLAKALGRRYTEIMVDEYQDTNAVQDLIFTALSRKGQNLFLVGDVKQSIYRFRLADPTIFLWKYQSFRPCESAREGEPRRVVLSQNFRSRREVLEAVNFLFRNLMSEEFGEMDYTEEDALYPGADYPENEKAQVELRVIDLAAGEENPEEEKPELSQAEAHFAAARIKSLLESGFPVFDKDTGRMRPVSPGDIVILLRAPGSVLHHYVRALGERDIPCQAEGGEDFLSSMEVSVALSFLSLLDNARQDIPLISVLRSPVFSFSPDDLASIRSFVPEGDFYEALEAAAKTREDCRSFLEALAAMRDLAPDLGMDQLIWQLYNRLNLLGVFGALPGGERRQSNLVMLYEHARRFERAGHRGLYDFLHYIDRLLETGRGLAPPRGQTALNAVRIMSIHKSKGLEFPVVLLAGLGKRFNRTDLAKPILVHPVLGVGPKLLDREQMVEYPTLARKAVERKLDLELRAEELRLLYVAMTRAKEKLILCCALPDAASALQKLAADSRCPMEPQVLAAAPSMAGWILPLALARPDGAPLREAAGAVVEHLAEDAGLTWDVRVVDGGLLFQKENAFPLRAPFPEEGEETENDLPETLFYRYPYEPATKLPSKLTATELKGRELDREAAEEAVPFSKRHPYERPRLAMEERGLTPAERGVALHLAMQHIDFDQVGSLEGVEQELRRLAEEGFLTDQQAEAVPPEKIAALFSSPLGKLLKNSEALRREFKFSVLVPAEDYFPEVQGETVLLQGVVDCYAEEADGLTVVDFKTDRVSPGAEALRAGEYREQLETYGKALYEITGKPVKKKILYFFQTDTAVEL